MADRSLGLLLDASVVVAHLRGKLNLFSQCAPGETLFLPLVAVGELYKGALKSSKPEENRALVDAVITHAAVLHPDAGTAEWYAKIAVQLESTGERIPENDLWIAAAALECDLPIATRDAHFERIPGLTVLRW